jgi:hypothetical protein
LAFLVPDWDRRGISENDFGGLDILEQNPFRAFNVAGWWEDVDAAVVDQRTVVFKGVEFDEVADVVEGDVFYRSTSHWSRRRGMGCLEALCDE